ncbi:MAG: DNA recombination protein RmuC [Candidatus Margulisbacteria bacterium]|nr:DNA recombination protein RmuC [Candidatus Margulisiibacteriota bacterium]MBU1616295.1 DNA recombination protein RmuC [Candidatus Margulisiibacteriota bacterium]
MLDIIESLRKEVSETSTKNRQEVQQNLTQISEQLSRSLTDSSQTIQKQFAMSANIIKEVTEKLTKLDETNKQVLDFSSKLQSLENILRNPKQRGILGEYILDTLLGNVLAPGQYKAQYKFKNGDLVDFVIVYRDKLIPIDAKFSLEKYNRIMEENNETARAQLEKDFKVDLKNRIDETSKYIRPVEGTTDFAFMFIPAEGVFYNLLMYKVGTLQVSSHDLIEYAFKKHVIIVSPTTFFAYLETVIHGMRALQTEEHIKDIIKKVNELAKHLINYEEYMKKVGGSLGTTVNQYNQAYKEFGKIDKDIYKITEGESGGSVVPELLAHS